MIIINKLAVPITVSLLAAVLTGPITAAAVEHRYTVTIDADLRRLRVAARFARSVTRVVARSARAAAFLDDPRNCATDERLTTRGRRLLLPAAGIDCLSYSIDLYAAAREDRRNATLSPTNVIVSPTVWLWRPAADGPIDLQVEFRLPENMRVALPWERLPHGDTVFRVPPSPESGSAPVAFGDFETHIVDVIDSRLSVALLRTGDRINADGIIDWVRDAAANVGFAYGRFPNPAAQVIVIPIGRHESRGNSPVPFGRVVRDGGESVELFVDESRPIDEYYSDWTATHEFSHLMLPHVDRRHRWVSEGFAQYYQNVLLARSRNYTNLYAWQKLSAGLERGRQSRPDLSPNEAAAEAVRGVRMKVYWTGAALALMADVELRARSNGRDSLDDLLDRLQRCCLPSQRSWSGPELLTKLDSFVDDPLFMPLYRRYADTTGFPDVTTLQRRLGIDDCDGRVCLRDDADLAHIRRAIMTRDNRAHAGVRSGTR